MANSRVQRKYLFLSFCIHIGVLLMLALSFSFQAQTPVVESSMNKENVIQAALVSRSVPKPPPKPVVQEPPKPVPTPPKVEPPPKPKPIVPEKPVAIVKPDVIPLKVTKKKIIPKKDPAKIFQELAAKQLLTDLKKAAEKKTKPKSAQVDFAKTLKQQAEKSLQQQLLNEQNRLESTRSQQMQGVVDKYKALVLQAISQNWLIPGAINKSLRSELMIRTAPGGMVLDVQLVKSSGNPAFDRSVRAAVLKASPLPVPEDADAFEQFRQFVLKVRPQDIIASDNLLN